MFPWIASGAIVIGSHSNLSKQNSCSSIAFHLLWYVCHTCEMFIVYLLHRLDSNCESFFWGRVGGQIAPHAYSSSKEMWHETDNESIHFNWELEQWFSFIRDYFRFNEIHINSINNINVNRFPFSEYASFQSNEWRKFRRSIWKLW